MFVSIISIIVGGIIIYLWKICDKINYKTQIKIEKYLTIIESGIIVVSFIIIICKIISLVL